MPRRVARRPRPGRPRAGERRPRPRPRSPAPPIHDPSAARWHAGCALSRSARTARSAPASCGKPSTALTTTIAAIADRVERLTDRKRDGRLPGRAGRRAVRRTAARRSHGSRAGWTWSSPAPRARRGAPRRPRPSARRSPTRSLPRGCSRFAPLLADRHSAILTEVRRARALRESRNPGARQPGCAARVARPG